MKNKRITNKEKVRQALAKVGHRLSIKEVSHLTGLTKTQVRGTANYYNSDIVSVSKGEINLLSQAYKGRGLRVTPTKDDVKSGIICSDELSIYLWFTLLFKKTIFLSGDGITFTPTKEKTSSNSKSLISGFSKWYKLTNFQAGDDIIFRCYDFKNRKFEITRLPFQKRNEEEILHQNSKLGEIIYDILNHYMDKCDLSYFLARNYLLKDLYLDKTLPDQYTRALQTNPYLFIFNKGTQRFSYSNIGIKKYFYHHRGVHKIVNIIEDEMVGRCGYCFELESFMKWDKDQGWRPAKEGEYFGLTLDKSFFKRK